MAHDALVPFAVRTGVWDIRGMRGGEGEAALLLHGINGSWRNFRPWLPTLAPRRHVLIPDLPGFGASPAPRVRPSLTGWANGLEALLAATETAPRVLIGLGMGASLALAYLARSAAARSSLTRLVLHTPAYCPSVVRPVVRRTVALLTSPLAFHLARPLLDPPAVRTWFARRLFLAPATPPDDARLLEEDFRRASLDVLRGLTRDMLQVDFRPLLATISTPTLAIVSEADPFVVCQRVEDLATLMPHARVAVQRGLAHGWTPAAIAEQNRLLAEFLSGGSSAA